MRTIEQFELITALSALYKIYLCFDLKWQTTKQCLHFLGFGREVKTPLRGLCWTFSADCLNKNNLLFFLRPYLIINIAQVLYSVPTLSAGADGSYRAHCHFFCSVLQRNLVTGKTLKFRQSSSKWEVAKPVCLHAWFIMYVCMYVFMTQACICW